MTISWRPLAVAAALLGVAGVAPAAAQTVMVRNAPAGSAVEVMLNAARAGAGTVEADGVAIVPVDMVKAIGKPEVDADIYVDVCDNLRRVLIVERGQPAPPQAAECPRRDSAGFFLVQRGSTVVVNAGGAVSTVMLRQGRVSRDPEAAAAPSTSPTGLVVFGGGGMVWVRDAAALACGNVTDCSRDTSAFAYSGGVALWFTRFLAAEGTYIKPVKFTTEGRGENFRFDTSLDPHVVTVAGVVGLPLRRVRLFGKIGGNYHHATSTTAQTIADVERGTQTFELRTSGWSWMFGGGGEVWFNPSLAIYGEAGRIAIKGDALDAEEGAIDDRFTTILVGVRVRIAGG